MKFVVLFVLAASSFLQPSISQFSPTDGTNDLFALFTQCPITPRYPPDNQFLCYRTNARVSFGFTLCDPVFVRQRSISVADRTDTHTVYFINTPGRLRGANYVNRLLCRWNIRCAPGQLMYFDFPEHDIEEAVSSPFFIDPVCLDYLKISRDFADFFSCGTDVPEGDLEPSRLLVEFRSNRRGRSPGFRMRAICFDPTTQNGIGCTTTMRSKRDTENERKYNLKKLLTPKEHDILNKVIREKRDPTASRFTQETVDVEAKVVYFQRALSVLLGDKVILNFPNIDSFHTYNEFNGVISYYGNILGNNTITLRGFGVILVVDNIAYYVLFGVDSRFLPNESEQRTIRTLLNAEEVVVADDDFIIKEDDYGKNNHGKKRSIDDEIQSHTRGKRTQDTFPAEIVAMAQANQNSCNAVLKAAAQSIINNL